MAHTIETTKCWVQINDNLYYIYIHDNICLLSLNQTIWVHIFMGAIAVKLPTSDTGLIRV